MRLRRKVHVHRQDKYLCAFLRLNPNRRVEANVLHPSVTIRVIRGQEIMRGN